MDRRLHAHTPGTRTPRHPRNWGRILENHFHVSTVYPLTLDTYKQRHTPQSFTNFYISHTCSLSHRKPNAPSLRTRTHSKTLEADQPRAENKKFRRIRRRCKTNQSQPTHPPPNIGAYKTPHLQSQFPPNLTPTQPERSTPSFLQIHWPNRHPTKFSLTKARKMMTTSQHHHAV